MNASFRSELVGAIRLVIISVIFSVATIAIGPAFAEADSDCRTYEGGPVCEDQAAAAAEREAEQIVVTATRLYPGWYEMLLNEFRMIFIDVIELGRAMVANEKPKDTLIGEVTKKAIELFKLPCKLAAEKDDAYTARAIAACIAETTRRVDEGLPWYFPSSMFRTPIIVAVTDACTKKVADEQIATGGPVPCKPQPTA
jgi:hypothetical protein